MSRPLHKSSDILKHKLLLEANLKNSLIW